MDSFLCKTIYCAEFRRRHCRHFFNETKNRSSIRPWTENSREKIYPLKIFRTGSLITHSTFTRSDKTKIGQSKMVSTSHYIHVRHCVLSSFFIFIFFIFCCEFFRSFVVAFVLVVVIVVFVVFFFYSNGRHSVPFLIETTRTRDVVTKPTLFFCLHLFCNETSNFITRCQHFSPNRLQSSGILSLIRMACGWWWMVWLVYFAEFVSECSVLQCSSVYDNAIIFTLCIHIHSIRHWHQKYVAWRWCDGGGATPT